MSEPRRTVLVVDDELEVVEALKRNLRHEPFDFIGTTSPEEALAIIDQRRVDLVIADIDMPEMNGLSLVTRLSRTHPAVVRILLTGDASLESAMTAINEGEVHRYLTKPWNTAELREIVRGALERGDELQRASQASRDVAERDRFLTELVQEHPTIRHVTREDGAYVLDAERLRNVTTSLADANLRALFDANATVGPKRDGMTQRSGE